MSHWVGALLLAAGIVLIVTAVRRRERVRRDATAAIARGDAIAAGHRHMTALAEIVPPLVHIALGIAAIQVVIAWWYTRAGAWFSAFDVGGFLFFLVAYGIWLSLKSRYRPGWRPE